MRKGILLTLPRYDIVTEYLSSYSGAIERISEEKGIFIKSLEGPKANKIEFEKTLVKLDCKFTILNGHGSDDCITGDKGEILIRTGENEQILKDRIVYARSCEAAAVLGEECIKDSEGCFIGYVLPFEFYFNSEWAGNPMKDNTARLFLESSNLVPISIIKGNSTEEAHERSKSKMLKNIKKVLREKTNESFSIAESLWNNYLGQKLLGNRHARL